MTAAPSEPASFTTSRSFQFFYLLPVLLAGALVVDRFVNGRSGSWPWILGALLLAGVTVPRALARVEVDGERLTLFRPLHAPQQLPLRRLVSMERSSRIGHALILRYRPAEEAAPEEAGDDFLGLPPLAGQADLEALLQAFIDT